MYKAFFGFAENPFNMSPDPSFLFRSSQHEEALANLIYGVQSRKGFVVLTGEVGTGKTTMLECLRDFLHSQQIASPRYSIRGSRWSSFSKCWPTISALRCNAHFQDRGAVRAEQDAPRAGRRWGVPRCSSSMKRTTWIGTYWKRSGLLGNLENRRGKCCRFMLAGQPELDRKLEAPEFRQLKQRMALRCVLEPLQLEETLEYIQSRLTRAGLKEQTVFPPEILREIHFRTQGIPRLINAMCDNLLLDCLRPGDQGRGDGHGRRGGRGHAPAMARPEAFPGGRQLCREDLAGTTAVHPWRLGNAFWLASR